MSTTYAGKSVAIVSSTNASPIAIVATAHGYSNGDVVQIAGHATNTAANGEWPIAVTGVNGFTLTGSTGNGVGGATGTVTAFVGSVTLISDGDSLNASALNTPEEGSADREMYFYRELQDRRAGNMRFAAQSIVRVAETTPEALAADWSKGGAGVPQWVNNATGTVLWIPVDLPHGSVWTAASVLTQGNAHSALPAGMSSISPCKMAKSTGVVTSAAGFSATPDPSASTAALDAVHTWGATGGTEVVDRSTYRYYVTLTAESGANSTNGTRYFCTSTTFTTSALDVGAA